MKKFKLLVLTDHSGHSQENALYAMVREMQSNPICGGIDIASRGISLNDVFFEDLEDQTLLACKSDYAFEFKANGDAFRKSQRIVEIQEYDAVWLRLPPPFTEKFACFLESKFPKTLFINRPKGILKTGDKAFLTNFSNLCAPTKLCNTAEDIIDFKEQFSIVLKPLKGYGGKGIVKIVNDQVWEGSESMSFEDFMTDYTKNPISYLGVKYLENVANGDKRIIVIDGEIMGASLRLPKDGSWLCNVAMGGQSVKSSVSEEEVEMVKVLNPVMKDWGVVMYGVDTLEDDNGKRILSEINTTSIGGLPQIAAMRKEPLVEKAIDLIWSYFETKNDLKKKK